MRARRRANADETNAPPCAARPGCVLTPCLPRDPTRGEPTRENRLGAREGPLARPPRRRGIRVQATLKPCREGRQMLRFVGFTVTRTRGKLDDCRANLGAPPRTSLGAFPRRRRRYPPATDDRGLSPGGTTRRSRARLHPGARGRRSGRSRSAPPVAHRGPQRRCSSRRPRE